MASLAIPLITTGISALSGLWGDKKKRTEQSQFSKSESGSTTGSMTDIGRSSTTQGPQLTPAYQNFINQLVSSFSNLAQPVNLQPYAASQVQGINRTSDIARRSVDNIMAARGLSRSPVAGTAAANVDANRIAQIVGVNQSLPLLQQQLNLQNLGAAQSMASLLPGFSPTTSVTDSSGTRATQGTSYGTSSGTGSGSATETGGGGIGGLMSVLALMAQKGDSPLRTLLAQAFPGGN